MRLDGYESMIKLCGCGWPAQSKGVNAKGEQIFRSNCSACRTAARKSKKDSCERCGFIPEDKVQLDVDHIDGDRSNNDITNLQTLCANCHRLKTKQNRDFRK